MKRIFLVACGALLVLGSLWGCSYGVYLYPMSHWANFPIVMTGFMAFFGGLALIAASF